jgi:VanZ family protein
VRLIFTLLSIVYIAAIFLWADSPVVSVLAPFNPYSLLHIPLYGILAILLIFSFLPIKLNHNNQRNQINQRNYFIVGLVAFGIAIADEIHQSFIPTRDASVIDIFLDAVGIVLVIYLILWFYKIKKRAFNFEP